MLARESTVSSDKKKRRLPAFLFQARGGGGGGRGGGRQRCETERKQQWTNHFSLIHECITTAVLAGHVDQELLITDLWSIVASYCCATPTHNDIPLLREEAVEWRRSFTAVAQTVLSLQNKCHEWTSVYGGARVVTKPIRELADDLSKQLNKVYVEYPDDEPRDERSSSSSLLLPEAVRMRTALNGSAGEALRVNRAGLEPNTRLVTGVAAGSLKQQQQQQQKQRHGFICGITPEEDLQQLLDAWSPDRREEAAAVLAHLRVRLIGLQTGPLSSDHTWAAEVLVWVKEAENAAAALSNALESIACRRGQILPALTPKQVIPLAVLPWSSLTPPPTLQTTTDVLTQLYKRHCYVGDQKLLNRSEQWRRETSAVALEQEDGSYHLVLGVVRTKPVVGYDGKWHWSVTCPWCLHHSTRHGSQVVYHPLRTDSFTADVLMPMSGPVLSCMAMYNVRQVSLVYLPSLAPVSSTVAPEQQMTPASSTGIRHPPSPSFFDVDLEEDDDLLLRKAVRPRKRAHAFTSAAPAREALCG